MKRKYIDPRIEKMVAPLRAADRAAEQRFAVVIQDHKQLRKKQREQAALLATIIRRDSLVHDVIVKGATILVRLRHTNDAIVVAVKTTHHGG